MMGRNGNQGVGFVCKNKTDELNKLLFPLFNDNVFSVAQNKFNFQKIHINCRNVPVLIDSSGEWHGQTS